MFYIGVVEDRHDPDKMGRVRVRVLGLHTDDLVNIPKEALPWASVLMPTTGSSTTGVSETPALVEGTWVLVTFSDTNKQDPIILGSIPSMALTRPSTDRGFSDPNGVYPIKNRMQMPDLHPRTRGQRYPEDELFQGVEGLTAPEKGWDAFNPEYPYNQVKATEAGHYKEYDNTEGNSRIKEKHKSGTFYEIQDDGTQVTHIVKDNYTITANDDTLYVGGNLKIVVVGDANIEVKQNANVDVSGNTNIACAQNIVAGAGKNFTLGAEDDFYIKAWNVKIDSNTSGRIDLNYEPSKYTVDLNNFKYGEPIFGSPGGAVKEGQLPGGPYAGGASKAAFERKAFPFFDSKPIDNSYNEELGKTSERYDTSVAASTAAIDWDESVGTTFGKYQMSTKTGTFDNFMDYLEAKNKTIYDKLIDQDESNWGTWNNDATSVEEAASNSFSEKWVATAEEHPELAQYEHGFMKHTHYDALVANTLLATAINIDDYSIALKNVAWSVALQHGSQTSLFINALESLDSKNPAEETIINTVYDERDKVETYFPLTGISELTADGIRLSAKNRYIRERRDALQLKAELGS